MMDTYIRAKIDAETKHKAMETLKRMGISISDYIRLAVIQLADKKAIPFDIRVPNSLTNETIEKSVNGKDIYTATDTKDLFDKLGI